MVIKKALKVSKDCLENENPNMGFAEHSDKKIELAGTQIVQQGYNGIYVDAPDFP